MAPKIYQTTDQIMIFSLLLCGIRPVEVKTMDRQCVFCFDTEQRFKNNGTPWTVDGAIQKLSLGNTDGFLFSLKDYWDANNVWLMSIRNTKRVLTD